MASLQEITEKYISSLEATLEKFRITANPDNEWDNAIIDHYQSSIERAKMFLATLEDRP